ncbi:MAG: flippase-like domain-containing protein [Chloroflexi bacterium]|nr:MAG: flippase-like domain-containing protein [Chloroflexota bacterium]
MDRVCDRSGPRPSHRDRAGGDLRPRSQDRSLLPGRGASYRAPGAEAMRLMFVLWALGLELPASGIVFVAVATSLLTTVPLTPAGFGFVEIAMVYVLTEGFGLSQSNAVAVAVLDRAVSVFSVIVVGAIVYVRSDRSERVGG